jgi:Protein of unknown function (DUF3365)
MKKLFFTIMLVGLIISACGNRELKEEEKLEYAKKGSLIAQKTFMQLSTQLKQAIAEKGPVEAIGFCNISAISITEGISTKNKAIVKRATDKPRNPQNLASEEELRIIERLKNEMTTGNQPMPVVEIDKTGNPHFYAAIILKEFCLQCHGNESEIAMETGKKIKTLYPNDQAISYKTGDLRGIWSISFPE